MTLSCKLQASTKIPVIVFGLDPVVQNDKIITPHLSVARILEANFLGSGMEHLRGLLGNKVQGPYESTSTLRELFSWMVPWQSIHRS